MPDPLPAPFVVESAGFYADVDELTYHADPVPGGSLSHTGARKILESGATFKEYRDHPEPPKRAFDFGHAAHAKVLGVGLEIVVVNADDWRTKAAQQQAKEARERGAVPLLKREADTVDRMAAKLRENRIAAALLQPTGTPELSMFWRDEPTGVWCRGRLDWMPAPIPGRRLLVADYKTSTSANPKAFRKAAADFGYHQQADWYLDGLRALGVADAAAFLFIVQERTPPYLVSVIELGPLSMRRGAELNQEAREKFADYSAFDVWPGYGDDVVHQEELPRWAL